MSTDLEFADEMVTKFKALLKQCAGLTSITVDGQTYQFDDLNEQYRFWRSEARRLSGLVGSIQSMDLSQA
jgi:hypothetical protein